MWLPSVGSTVLLFPTLSILVTSFTTTKQCQHKHHTTTRITTALFSLKPAAIPLMDSGKALARSGELLIDLTTKLDLYGGSLSGKYYGIDMKHTVYILC